MQYSRLTNYKVWEIDGALMIMQDIGGRIPPKHVKAQPLIVSDYAKLLPYLDRYIYEREQGKTLAEAHALAMQTANITHTQPAANAHAKTILLPGPKT